MFFVDLPPASDCVTVMFSELCKIGILEKQLFDHCYLYFDLAFYYLAGTDSNETFSESCPMKFLSSCEKLESRRIRLKKRRIFIHVNIMENYRNERGFLAGFTIYKSKGMAFM